MTQLVDQHRLRLDDSLARYLSGVVPEGSKITIRDLLEQESGLANFTDYVTRIENADQSRALRPIDTLGFAASKPLLFEPGTQWSYALSRFFQALLYGRVVSKTAVAQMEQTVPANMAAALGVQGVAAEGVPNRASARASAVASARDRASCSRGETR